MKSIEEILKEPVLEKNDTYFVFIIQGYERKLDNGDVLDVCELQLIDISIDNAIKRAKKIMKKPFYRVRMIIENFRKKE